MVEEARCDGAALIGSQGVEMHVGSAASDRVTGRCQQDEVSTKRIQKCSDYNANILYNNFIF